MRMRINQNILSLNVYNNYLTNLSMLTKSFERLSSGLRINRAADDPSGLAVSEKMRAQIRGLNQANRNAQDGLSMLTIAEGALNETHSILHRLRELAVQAANDTLTTSDRRVIQTEFDVLVEEVDRIANQTEFNRKPLISDNPFVGKLQVGANRDQTIQIALRSMDADAINIDQIRLVTQNGANAAIDTLDQAIYSVSNERARIGGWTNRLERVINVNTNIAENTALAESRIRDADMAREMMEFTKYNLLLQVAQALMAQANQYPFMLLQLLRSN